MSEIGEIGAIYEDRRTKKKGKLIERDEKYKTLLMEASDGKSFNITFGGFKSNWRKVDEPEQTVEEAMQEEIPEDEITVNSPVKAPVKKKTKVRKPQAPRNVSTELEATTLKILDYAKSFNSVRVSANVVPKKRNIIVKVDSRRIFIITYMVRNDNFMLCVHEKLFVQVKDNEYVTSAKFNDSWQSMKYSFIVDKHDMDNFLDDARSYIVDYLSGDAEEE